MKSVKHWIFESIAVFLCLLSVLVYIDQSQKPVLTRYTITKVVRYKSRKRTRTGLIGKLTLSPDKSSAESVFIIPESQETIPDENLKGSTVTVSQTAIFKAWIKYQISKNNVVAYDNITNSSSPAAILIGLGLIPAIIIAGKLLLKRGAYYSELEPAFNAFV